jgi:cysteine-rich repeat protein
VTLPLPRFPIMPLRALLVVLLVAVTAAERAHAAPCAAGRFVVEGDTPLLTGATSPVLPDAVVIAPTTLGIASGCDATPFRERATKKGTRLRAKWPFCQEGPKHVRLQVVLAPDCDTVTGRIRMRGVPKRKFTAHRSRCGDTIVDTGGGEECDDGNTIDGDGCQADCTVPTRQVSGTLSSANGTGAVVEEADVALSIEPGKHRIRLAITPTTFRFDLCTASIHLLQAGGQVSFTTGDPDPASSIARAAWDAFAGCGGVFDGAVVSGTLTDLPPWFDLRAAFVVLYDFGTTCRNAGSVCTIDVPAAG